MRAFRTVLLAATLAVFGVAASHADSLTEYFNLSCQSAISCDPAVPGSASPTPVAPIGQITLTLNGNGTVAASLEDYGPGDIIGLGFNSSAVNLPESGFSLYTPAAEFGWLDDFGYQPSGFACNSSYCGLGESWVIGNPGDYTSVLQVLNGGAGAQTSVDFFLYDFNGDTQWGADEQSYSTSPAPEPGSFLLLGTGALGLIGTIRRKLTR
jgi:hypothetical protein